LTPEQWVDALLLAGPEDRKLGLRVIRDEDWANPDLPAMEAWHGGGNRPAGRSWSWSSAVIKVRVRYEGGEETVEVEANPDSRCKGATAIIDALAQAYRRMKKHSVWRPVIGAEVVPQDRREGEGT